MNAPEAAVARVQEALGCAWGGGSCLTHQADWTDRGCPAAVAAADAAVAPIAAQTLRDVAQERGERGYYGDALTRTWLRERADQIEADDA